MPRRLLCAASLLGAFLMPAAPTRAAEDLAVGSRAWNGLAAFVQAARSAGVRVETPQELSLDQLTPKDGVLLVYPRRPPPRAALVAFMRAGGRAGLADDFGEGGAILSAFRIGRHDPTPPAPEHRLRGNRNVLIAEPGLAHPLTEDVAALVTNHPQALHHTELDAVFSLGRDGGAVVLAGAVGDGRLVAIGDSSVLMNNMLAFRGNRAFAANLARYLAQDGRLFVVAGSTRIRGSFGGVHGNDRLGDLRASLEQLADVELPPIALALTSTVIAAILLFVAATALPRGHAHAAPSFLTASPVPAGFAGRVAFFAGRKRNLLAPALSLKAEVEQRLVTTLELDPQPQLSQVLARLSERGVDAATVDHTRAFLLDLDRLQMEHSRHGPPPRVDRRRFHALVEGAERILDALDTKPQTR